MKTSLSTRRGRRGGLLRTAGWLSAAAMIAVAAFAPATAAAADPHSMDVACNNIRSGARSPEYVWVSVGPDGVTASWATDAAHFDAAGNPTVTIRVCVFDAAGEDQGAIDQDTENDGQQLFAWSLLGYEANPCPDDDLTFGGSADSPAVNTKKSNLIDCPADEETTPPADEETTPPADEETTPPADDETTPPSDEETTPPADDPGDQGESSVVTDNPNPPTDPGDNGNANTGGNPAPTGAVQGLTGTPETTLPPTDTTLVSSQVAGGDAWRLVLIAIAGVLASILAFTRRDRVRRPR
jgi:hypothetical protein